MAATIGRRLLRYGNVVKKHPILVSNIFARAASSGGPPPPPIKPPG